MRGLVVLCALVVVLTIGAGGAKADTIVPVEGGWTAETSAGLPVHFGVKDGRVLNTRFQFRWGFCGIFTSHDRGADVEVDPAGHWAYDDPRGQTLEGTFVALGDSLRFFLFVNRGAAVRLPGVAGYGLRGRHLEGGGLANTDVMLWTPHRKGEGRAQRRERDRVLRAVRATVCRRQTGEACPAI